MIGCKLNDDPWKHITSELITYWIEQFRLYDYYANGLPVVSTDNLKMIILESDVRQIPDRCSVALNQAQLDFSTESFDQYFFSFSLMPPSMTNLAYLLPMLLS